MPEPTDPFTTLEKLTRAVECIDESYPEARKQISEVRRLIRKIESDIEFGFQRAERRGFATRKKPKAAKAVTGYSIAQSRQGAALSEQRSTEAADFRCPRRAYNAVAEAIEIGDEIQKFDDIHKAVTRLLNQEVPTYWVRVVTRFFVNQGMLNHSRARFRPESQSGFVEAAKVAWKMLEARS